jgi:hypothetical protein
MKKLGLATALLLTLAFGAGDVLAQNSNSPAPGGGTMTASKHSRRRHHRRMMRRRHRRHHKAANANT